MPAVTAPSAVVLPFAASGLRNAIPVASLIPTVPGAASYTDGFPPLTMTEEDAGGLPPDGKDMNGILYAISAYCAWLQAGGFFVWSAAVASAGGYPQHAVIRSASDFTKLWYNTTADNVNNPDVTPTGWTQYSLAGTGSGGTGVQSPTLAAGSTNDLALTNTAVAFIEATANASGSTLTGLAGGGDGQVVTITNVSANTLTLAALTGSSSGNQFRLPTDMTLLQNQSMSFKYSSTIAKWVAL
jgi:hypothetical protein